MNNNSDKFDHLIALAATKCIKEEAQKFNDIDTSDVVFDPSYYRKRNRIINKYKRRSSVKFAKTVAIRLAAALMILITLGCVLIGCVPEWREAIYKAIAEWYDDYFAVRYESPNGKEMETLYPEETVLETKDLTDAPTLIEHIRKPSDLPEGVWEDFVMQCTTSITIDYYYNDQYILSFSQLLLKPHNNRIDNEEGDITYIKINGNDATVVEYVNKKEIYIFWDDGEYSYHVSSTECDMTTLIKYAESVK